MNDGIMRDKKKPTPMGDGFIIEWEKAQELRDNGVSARNVAELYGLNFKTVCAHTDSPQRTIWHEGAKVLITHYGQPTVITIKEIIPKRIKQFDDTVVTNIGNYPFRILKVLHEDALERRKHARGTQGKRD